MNEIAANLCHVLSIIKTAALNAAKDSGFSVADAMTRFETLPGNVRTLLLAKLAIEMRQLNAIDLCHLAVLRRVTMTELWHGICRKAQQPVCALPLGAMPSIERRHASPPAHHAVRVNGLAR